MRQIHVLSVLVALVFSVSPAHATSIPADMRKPKPAAEPVPPATVQQRGPLAMLQRLFTGILPSPHERTPAPIPTQVPTGPSGPLATSIALALLQCPPDSRIPEFLHTVEIREALKAVCLEAELLDRKETFSILATQENFVASVNLMRRRHQRLWNAPSAWDASRYPSREIIGQQLRANQEYRQFLVNNQQFYLHMWWDYQIVIQETDMLYRIWSAVQDAGCEHHLVTKRRTILRKLRDEILGPEMYYAGALPPNVPIWRFRRVD